MSEDTQSEGVCIKYLVRAESPVKHRAGSVCGGNFQNSSRWPSLDSDDGSFPGQLRSRTALLGGLAQGGRIV